MLSLLLRSEPAIFDSALEMLLWRKIELVQKLHILQIWKDISHKAQHPSPPFSSAATVPMASPIAVNPSFPRICDRDRVKWLRENEHLISLSSCLVGMYIRQEDNFRVALY